MQDVDRPPHIESLPEPARTRRPRVQVQSLRIVPRAKGLDWIGGHCGRRRHLGQGPPVRPPEPERAVGLSLHLVAFLVDGAVVPAT